MEAAQPRKNTLPTKTARAPRTTSAWTCSLAQPYRSKMNLSMKLRAAELRVSPRVFATRPYDGPAAMSRGFGAPHTKASKQAGLPERNREVTQEHWPV